MVVTNGSEEALVAVRRAGRLARDRHAVVHVLAIPEDVARWHFLRSRAEPTDPATYAERALERAASELYEIGVFVQRHVSDDAIGSAIVELAKRTGASAVVVPALTALELDGRQLPCPVDVVGDDDGLSLT